MLDTEDFGCAQELLDEIGATELNTYETTQYWNFLAFVKYAQGDVASATAMYENVLRQSDLPAPMRQDTIYTLAQLYTQGEQYERALGQLDQWFQVADEVNPAVYYFKATIEYQLGRFDDATESLDLAMANKAEVPDAWTVFW